MKISILGLNDKRKTGLETWKDNLLVYFKKNNEIKEIYTQKWGFLMRYLPYALESDISHSYSQSIGTILILFLRKIMDKKNIHTVHGNFYAEQKDKKGIKQIFWIPFNKICISLADKVTFPSKYLRNEILKFNPKIKNKNIIIPNSINIKEISKVKGYSKKELGMEERDFLILEVTNFNLEEKAKGIKLLVEDFNKANIKNKKLLIIGGGKLLDIYKRKYESANIRFLGFRKDVIKIIKACDLFVHYSFLDSFGIVLLEAMACKKPVFAKGSPSFKEILGISSNMAIDNLNMQKILKLEESRLKFFDINSIGNMFEKEYKLLLKSK